MCTLWLLGEYKVSWLSCSPRCLPLRIFRLLLLYCYFNSCGETDVRYLLLGNCLSIWNLIFFALCFKAFLLDTNTFLVFMPPRWIGLLLIIKWLSFSLSWIYLILAFHSSLKLLIFAWYNLFIHIFLNDLYYYNCSTYLLDSIEVNACF